ncbi:MAG: YfhO family protein [bacterium]
MANRTSSLRRLASPDAILFFVTIAFLFDVALTGRAYLLRDILTFFHPWQTAVKELVRGGALPLWNHDTYCGIPLLANLQSGVFYPPNWLYWILPFDVALTATSVLHLAIGAVLMRRFLGRIGLSATPALLGGALFAFSTWTVSYLEFPMKLGSAVWTPLLWSGLLDAMRFGQRRGVLRAAIAVALSVVAGYPQLAFFGLLSGTLLALFLFPEAAAEPGATPAGRLHRVLAWPVALGVGALVAAAQLVPAAEMTRWSAKTEPYETVVAVSRSLPWKGLVGLVDPFFLGFPGVDRYWGGDLVEYCFGAIGIGPLGLLLALAALPTLVGMGRRPRRHRGEPAEAPVVPAVLTRFLLAGTLLGLVLALGRHTPIYPWLHDHVPGFGRSRWPSTAGFLVVLHLAPLAAIGLARVRRSATRLRHLAFATAGVGLALVLAALLARGPLAETFRAMQLAGSPPYQAEAYEAFRADWISSLLVRGSLVLAAGAVGLVVEIRSRATIAWVVFALLDLFLAARSLEMPTERGFYDRVPAESRELAAELDGRRLYTPRSTDQLGNFLYGCRNPTSFVWAQRALLCNANVPAGVAQVQGCEPLNPRRHEAFVQIFDDEAKTPHAIRERIFDLWDAARMLEVKGVPPRDIPNLENPEAGFTWNHHEPRLGRASVVSGWQTLEEGPAVLDTLFGPSHDPGRITLLEVPDGQPEPPEPQRTPAGRAIAVEWTNGPNSLRAGWVGGDGGMLRVLESWAPGWEARVNGQPAPVYRADFLFLAVPVPPGTVTVELDYRPKSVRNGLLASAGGLLLLGLLAWPQRRSGAFDPTDS